jgi:S-disulfanyl-L-cysteine oxidoreductase SoxD
VLRALAISLTLICGPGGATAQKYRLGRIAGPAEIQARNVTVLPDGSGLPQGRGTAKQGRVIYAQQCAVCHGPKGEGEGPYPQLTGGQGTLKSAHPVLTIGSYWPYATTVWDYLNRAMPPQSPGNLNPNQTYSLTAFLLYLNGIVGENDEINAASLPKVQMPNRNGFIPDPRPDVKPARTKT